MRTNRRQWEDTGEVQSSEDEAMTRGIPIAHARIWTAPCRRWLDAPLRERVMIDVDSGEPLPM